MLREVFSYSYEEIAEIVGKSATYYRQIFHQAKMHLDEDNRRFVPPSKEAQQRLVERFIAASQQGEMQALADVLAQDISWWDDGGGKVYAAPYPLLSIPIVATGGLMLIRLRCSPLSRYNLRSMLKPPSRTSPEASVGGFRCASTLQRSKRLGTDSIQRSHWMGASLRRYFKEGEFYEITK